MCIRDRRKAARARTVEVRIQDADVHPHQIVFDVVLNNLPRWRDENARRRVRRALDVVIDDALDTAKDLILSSHRRSHGAGERIRLPPIQREIDRRRRRGEVGQLVAAVGAGLARWARCNTERYSRLVAAIRSRQRAVVFGPVAVSYTHLTLPTSDLV